MTKRNLGLVIGLVVGGLAAVDLILSCFHSFGVRLARLQAENFYEAEEQGLPLRELTGEARAQAAELDRSNGKVRGYTITSSGCQIFGMPCYVHVTVQRNHDGFEEVWLDRVDGRLTVVAVVPER